MAKHYNVGSSTFDNIRVNLLDYYGAYDVSTNPDGVDVKEYSTTLLIFTCSAISDKVIKILGITDFLCSYGDAYSGSGVITNETVFGGSSTTGNTTGAQMVCGDGVLLFDVSVSTLGGRLVIIGKLTDGAFAVLGLIQTSSYKADANGFLTATKTDFYPIGLSGSYTAGSKRVKMPLILVTSAGAVNDGSNLVTFVEVYSVSNALGATPSKGTGYYMTTSGGDTATSVIELGNSLIIATSN